MQEQWPEKIALYSVALSWDLDYQPQLEDSCIMLNEANQQLQFTGPIKQFADCRESLHQWLRAQAERYIIPWLQKLSKQHDLPYRQVSFRGQKTRWGSCSEDNDISLNYQLLFLPARLLRYVLIHELCHTKVLDHSKDFWRLVERFEPDYRRLKQELKRANQYVPSWVVK